MDKKGEMRMKKTNIKTTAFECKGGFMCDVVETDTEFQAWLYHKSYGTKELMFGVASDGSGMRADGVPVGPTNIDEFVSLIEFNIDEYIEDYRDEVMDEDD